MILVEVQDGEFMVQSSEVSSPCGKPRPAWLWKTIHGDCLMALSLEGYNLGWIVREEAKEEAREL